MGEGGSRLALLASLWESPSSCQDFEVGGGKASPRAPGLTENLRGQPPSAVPTPSQGKNHPLLPRREDNFRSGKWGMLQSGPLSTPSRPTPPALA